MLTKRQRDVLVFVDAHIRERGYSPSYDNIRDAIGAKSKSNVYDVLGALEERGFIRRLRNRARALEVLRNPDGSDKKKAPTRAPGVSNPRDVFIPLAGLPPALVAKLCPTGRVS